MAPAALRTAIHPSINQTEIQLPIWGNTADVLDHLRQLKNITFRRTDSARQVLRWFLRVLSMQKAADGIW